jgi:hypothetical protein
MVSDCLFGILKFFVNKLVYLVINFLLKKRIIIIIYLNGEKA